MLHKVFMVVKNTVGHRCVLHSFYLFSGAKVILPLQQSCWEQQVNSARKHSFTHMWDWSSVRIRRNTNKPSHNLLRTCTQTDSFLFPYAPMSLRSAILTWQKYRWTKDTTRCFRLLFIVHNMKRCRGVFHCKFQPALRWWGMSPRRCQNKLGQERKLFPPPHTHTNDLSLNMKIALMCLTVHQWSTFRLRFWLRIEVKVPLSREWAKMIQPGGRPNMRGKPTHPTPHPQPTPALSLLKSSRRGVTHCQITLDVSSTLSVWKISRHTIQTQKESERLHITWGGLVSWWGGR